MPARELWGTARVAHLRARRYIAGPATFCHAVQARLGRQSHKSRLADLALGALRGRRGAASMVLAGSATILLGFTGLAIEAGHWYLALRNATTAADLAALAGAAALERGDDYAEVAHNAAALNGFTQGVEVGPPTVGAFVGDASAVQVVVSMTPRISLSQLFLAAAPKVRRRAVATVRTDSEVCVLALGDRFGGGLELGGNSTTKSGNCLLGSNAPSPGGISVVGSARVRADGLITTGACTGCAVGDVWTDDNKNVRPLVVSGRADPIRDPFAGLRNWTPQPPPCHSPDVTTSKEAVTISPGKSICASLTIGVKETLNLEPGIYYFNNADLVVQGTIIGEGVTLVFTGDPDRVGTIRINAQAKGALTGPNTSLIPGHAEAAGVVIYRDARATNNGPEKEVQLNGGATMHLSGGLYFPTSDIVMNGKSNIESTCLSVVGYRLSFSGTADTEVGVSGCRNFTAYPTIRTVRLVE
jgi:Flp pilus assembly protein TadG